MTGTKKKGQATVLEMYFGRRPWQPDADLPPAEFEKLPYERQIAAGGLRGFAVELTRLNDAEKLELARLAVAELGLTQEEVSFPLAG